MFHKHTLVGAGELTMIEQISYYSTVFRDGNDPCDTMCTDLHIYYEF